MMTPTSPSPPSSSRGRGVVGLDEENNKSNSGSTNGSPSRGTTNDNQQQYTPSNDESHQQEQIVMTSTASMSSWSWSPARSTNSGKSGGGSSSAGKSSPSSRSGRSSTRTGTSSTSTSRPITTLNTLRGKSLVLVWLVTAGELLLDLITTLIAFLNFVRSSTCCGRAIDMGHLPLAIAVPYFVLIVVELSSLCTSIWYTRYGDAILSKHANNDDEDENSDLRLSHKVSDSNSNSNGNSNSNSNGNSNSRTDIDKVDDVENNNKATTTAQQSEREQEEEDADREEDTSPPSPSSSSSSSSYRRTVAYSRAMAAYCMRILGWMVLINPFFGFMVSWGLLYQSSKDDAMIVLGLEGGSLLLQWITVYLEHGNPCKNLSRCQWAIHLVPLLPFLVTIIAILIYLQKGGVCFRDGNFWYEGCVVCDDGTPAAIQWDLSSSASKTTTLKSWNASLALGEEMLSTWDGTTTCADGSAGTPEQTYCGTDTQFCWFPY